jgi:sodium transport system permease protein
MKSIWGIMKKELDKIFKNPRLIFSTLILPGFIIFTIYAFMGMSIGQEITKTEEHISKVYLLESQPSFDSFISAVKDEAKLDVVNVTQSYSEDEIKNILLNSEADVVIIESVDTNNKENFTLYFNQLNTLSSTAYSKMQSIIMMYKDARLASEYGDIDLVKLDVKTVGDQQKESGMSLAMLLPMIVITFVFSGSLSVGADAIAGEKERGTLGTLLMAPISKNQIILGKILSTTIITLLSSVSSFLGVLASLPFASKLFGLEGNVQYSVLNYISILLILLAVALMAVCLVLFASTFAKTIKEASMYAMPIYIVAILASTISMFSQELPKEIYYYCIPIYNCVLGLKGILSFSLSNVQLVIIIFSSIFYFVVLSWLLVRLFKNERILFAK